MMVRLAVISDIHCHPSSLPDQSFLKTDAPRLPFKNHPVESLLDLINREPAVRADVLLVGGDLGDRANQQGIMSAWSYLKEIRAALGAETLASTVGNHDVDSRHQDSGDAFDFIKRVATDYPFNSESAQRSFWSDGYGIIEPDEHLRLVVISSVASHHTPALAERGAIGLKQLETLDRELRSLAPRAFQVALVHHHPIQHEELNLGSHDLMEHGSELLEVLGNSGFQFVVHGHKHHPRMRYFDASGQQMVIFAAGSFAAMSAHLVSSSNLFHVIELTDSTLPSCGLLGRVRSWEFHLGRGWAEAHPKSAGIPHVAGFGCSESVASLATKVAALVPSAEGSTVPWSSVISQAPELEFVLPAHYKKLRNLLREQHGIAVVSDDDKHGSTEPLLVVRTSGVRGS